MLGDVRGDQEFKKVVLALKLKERLQDYVEGNEEAWKAEMRTEIERLAQVRFKLLIGEKQVFLRCRVG